MRMIMMMMMMMMIMMMMTVTRWRLAGATLAFHLAVLLRVGGSLFERAEYATSQSLAKLVRSIAHEYNFEDCALDVIYDSNYETNNSSSSFVLRQRLVNYLHGNSDDNRYMSLTQEKLNATSSETLERWLEQQQQQQQEQQEQQTCTNYLLFVEKTVSASRLMAARNPRSKIIVVTADSPWEVKDFLKSHDARAFVDIVIVARSTSHRTRSGTYLLYTHKLYTEGSGSSEPALLTSWANNDFTAKDVSLFPNKLKAGFMGHRLLTSVAENPPFTMKKQTTAGLSANLEDWDGLEVRILRLAASRLNFTVEFAEPRTAAASPLESVKNDVLLGVASAAIGGIYQTSDLTPQLFDTTTPHAEDCAAFISLASTALPKYRAILGPFQLTVWLLLCLSYFILIIPLSFNSNYTIISLIKHPRGLNHMFWFVFSTYTNSFVVKNPLLNYGLAKNSISILLGIYWVFTIIVTACYTGSIVSFITLPAYPTAMESANDLLAYRYRIGTLDHNGWERWFNVNTTDDPFLKRLFRKIEYVPSVLDGVKNASRAYFWPYAFLASKTSLDYLIQTDFAPTWTAKRSLMHTSKECFVRYNVIQLYPSKSLYTKSMNNFLLRATEAGLTNKIITDIDWEVQRIAMKMNKQITKRMPQAIRVEERILTVEDTEGMFLLLGTGFLLASIVLSLESLSNFWKKGKNNANNAFETLNFNAVHINYPSQIKPIPISARRRV